MEWISADLSAVGSRLRYRAESHTDGQGEQFKRKVGNIWQRLTQKNQLKF